MHELCGTDAREDDVLAVSDEAVLGNGRADIAWLDDHNLSLHEGCCISSPGETRVGRRTLMFHGLSSMRRPSESASMAAFEAESETTIFRFVCHDRAGLGYVHTAL